MADRKPLTALSAPRLLRLVFMSAVALLLASPAAWSQAETDRDLHPRHEKPHLLLKVRRGHRAGRESSSSTQLHGAEDVAEHLSSAAEQCNHVCDDLELPTGLGGKCSFLVEEDPFYLPDPAYVQCVKRHGIRSWIEELEFVLKYVEEIQNPSDCKDQSIPWQLVNNINWGLGASLSHKIAPLLWQIWLTGMRGESARSLPEVISLLKHWTLLSIWQEITNPSMRPARPTPAVFSNFKWKFADEDRRCGRGYSCWMRMSRCLLEDIPLDNVGYWDVGTCQKRIDKGLCALSTACQPHGYYNISNGYCHCSEGYGSARQTCRKNARTNWGQPSTGLANIEGSTQQPGSPSAAPSGPPTGALSGLKHIDVHKFGMPLVLRYMFDGPALRGLDGKLEKSNRADGARECITVQIRHGDACRDKLGGLKRICHPPEVYVRQVAKLIKFYGGSPYVFLATDNDDIVDPIIADFAKLGLETRLGDFDRGKYVSQRLIDYNANVMGKQGAMEIMYDIWAMSKCDMFVGSMLASPFKVAWQLAAGRKGYFPPFISVETPLGDRLLQKHRLEYLPGGRLVNRTCRCDEQPGRERCKCDLLLHEVSGMI